MRGKDLLLKIGNGANPETFTTIGAARTVSLLVNNHPVDATHLNSNGLCELQADAGIQSMEITLEGIFKDSSTEESLRLSAFSRTTKNYQLRFPNGDMIAGSFAVQNYDRRSTSDGAEVFSATLIRTGGSTFTPGV